MESVKTYGDWIRNGVLWLNVDFRNNLPLMNWNAARSLSPPDRDLAVREACASYKIDPLSKVAQGEVN